MLPSTVFAAAGDGEEARVSLEDLSLYPAPPPRPRYVQPGAGELERSVAALRTLAEPCAAWCRRAYDGVAPAVQGVVRFGSDAGAYLKNPPKDFYPRAAVIGFTGVLGLFLARGSRVKRLVYPAGLVAVSASLYYPEQAVAIARSGGDCVYDSAVQSYAALEKILKP